MLLPEHRALRDMDMDALRRMATVVAHRNGLAVPDDELIRNSAHKARFELRTLDPALRHESRKWLQDRGYTRQYGQAWPPLGELP